MTESAPQASTPTPHLSGIVIHWRNERQLEELLSAWPTEGPFPLCVVDNSGTTTALQREHSAVTWLCPDRNLGFGAGVNAGFRATSGPWRLILNPDVAVDGAALRELSAAAARILQDDPRAALIAPRLLSRGAGSSVANQYRWQLRPLTRRRHLLAQCLFLARPLGPGSEPEDGAPIEQPAAGALLVRQDAFEAVGGFDERFHPAWFEDVDLAHRLHDAGFSARYARTAQVLHEGGASVPSLGFGRFLVSYYRNLQRFARARDWHGIAVFAPFLVAAASVCRIPLVVVRKPRAAPSRGAAAVAFLRLALAAISGWRFGSQLPLDAARRPRATP